jgi:hypothetical protein
VSLSALKAFHEVLLVHKSSVGDSTDPKQDSKALKKSESVQIALPEGRAAWREAWDVWCQIGRQAACPEKRLVQPTQSFLTALMLIFRALFQLVSPE